MAQRSNRSIINLYNLFIEYQLIVTIHTKLNLNKLSYNGADSANQR